MKRLGFWLERWGPAALGVTTGLLLLLSGVKPLSTPLGKLYAWSLFTVAGVLSVWAQQTYDELLQRCLTQGRLPSRCDAGRVSLECLLDYLQETRSVAQGVVWLTPVLWIFGPVRSEHHAVWLSLCVWTVAAAWRTRRLHRRLREREYPSSP